MEQLILATAREIMREQGVAALNMHEVARRVRLSTQALYYYFPTKMAVYEALFVRGIALLGDMHAAALAGVDDVWEALSAGMTTYLGFAQQSPELWYLLFERPVPGFVPSARAMEASTQLLIQWSDGLRVAWEAGTLAPHLSLEQVTDFTNALMHGLTAAHLANEPHLPPGAGRFGALLPVAIAVLRAAWAPGHAPPAAIAPTERGQRARP